MTIEKTAEFFEDQTWLIYGKLAIPKKEAKEAIQSRGGRVVTSVSKKLSFLVWSGESLGPGDDIGSVKPRDTLKAGGLVIGEADFRSLLEGTVPSKLAQLHEAKAQSAGTPPRKAAKKTAKKTAMSKKVTTLAIDDLLVRTREALSARGAAVDSPPLASSSGYVVVAAAVDAAALACIEAGRLDLARSLATSVRPELSACAVKVALAADDGLDEAIDLVLEGVECAMPTDPYHATVRGWAAARALALSVAVEGKSPRAAELAGPADDIIDGFFAGERPHEDFTRVLQTQLALGQRRAAQQALKKWLRQDAESVGKAMACHALITTFSEDAEMTLRLIETIASSGDRSSVVEERFVEQFAGWSFADLDKLMHMVTPLQWPVYQALVAAGRGDDARRVLSEFEPHEQDYRGQVERHLALGDEAAADQLLRANASGDVALSVMALERGLESFEEAWSRHASRDPESSVMSAVTDLISLVEHALDQGYQHARYQPVLDAIETLFAMDFRTSYDCGVEQDRRLRWTALQGRIRKSEGDATAWTETIETETKRFKEFAAYAADSWARNNVAKKLVAWAIAAGAPELALKAANKITKSGRQDVARDVARAFLPGSPARALAALEHLAGEAADAELLGARNAHDGTLLVDGSASGMLLASLWAGVLR